MRVMGCGFDNRSTTVLAQRCRSVASVSNASWPGGHALQIGTRLFGGRRMPFAVANFFQHCCVQPLRASRLLTVIACHLPPRAIATPRAFNASAMARNVVAPARCIRDATPRGSPTH